MHELGIAQSIVDIIKQYVPEERVPAVTAVRVRLGPLSGVVPESLEFCFAVIVADTPLRSARLDLVRVPVIGRCDTCGRSFAVDSLVFLCPECGDGHVRLISGTDLQVVAVELDEARAEVS